MTLAKFVRIHTLTFYGPNNLNRDDLSRPKTAQVGTALRLRLSSQCVKRAWRLSDVMADVSSGMRTRSFWSELAREFSKQPGQTEANVLDHIHPLRQALEGIKTSAPEVIAEPVATEPATPDVAGAEPVSAGAEPVSPEPAAAEPVVKPKKGKAKPKKVVLTIDDLVGATYFYHASEIQAVRKALTASLTAGAPLTAPEAEDAVSNLAPSADVAMFGRMAASKRVRSVDAAVQVAPLFTTHKGVVEDDFFVACDDLNTGLTDDVAGSAHMGVAAFGSGLYYGYVNVDVQLLLDNLQGDVALAQQTLRALIQAVTTVSPSAKQNTYACHSLASYARVEIGDAAPCSLADAFAAPVTGANILESSIRALQARANSIARAFPSRAVRFAELNCSDDVGTEDDLVNLALQALVA